MSTLEEAVDNNSKIWSETLFFSNRVFAKNVYKLTQSITVGILFSLILSHLHRNIEREMSDNEVIKWNYIFNYFTFSSTARLFR